MNTDLLRIITSLSKFW